MTSPHSPQDPYEQVPAGWYPTPGGGKKYWDGVSWLTLPEPEPDVAPVPKSKRVKKIGLALGSAAVVASALAGGIVWKSSHDAEVRNAAIAASSSQAAADAADVAARAAQRAQEAAAAERSRRQRMITSLESSVEEMAHEHVSSGFISGPILDVSCDPVTGGSTDDLTEQTTVFECFVANQELEGGRLRGFNYHAKMNWDSGRYTYGFGAP